MAGYTGGEWRRLVGDVVTSGPATGFAQIVEIGPHRFAADEPLTAGGTDTGPTPYDLLAAALGTCTLMTLGFYARREGIPLESVTVHVRHSKIHAIDCESCDTTAGRIDRLDREIALTGALTDAQRADLLRIADRCPVHRTLTSKIDIQTRLI
jgi:putative redox protein